MCVLCVWCACAVRAMCGVMWKEGDGGGRRGQALFATDINGAPLLQAEAGPSPLTTMMLPESGQALLFTGNASGQVAAVLFPSCVRPTICVA
eukprot:238760-Rhodomonas_salina.1